jgi:predicted nucleotidyltransferase
LWEQLSDRPDIERFRQYIETVLAERGEEIEFMVLYGSMARGNWSRGSDFDLLIGLRGEDGKRFLDRIYEYERIAAGPVEPFVYSKHEWQAMWQGFHLTLLEAADYGICLFDRGAWAQIRREFAHHLQTAIIERRPGGWQRYPERQVAIPEAMGKSNLQPSTPSARQGSS